MLNLQPYLIKVLSTAITSSTSDSFSQPHDTVSY